MCQEDVAPAGVLLSVSHDVHPHDVQHEAVPVPAVAGLLAARVLALEARGQY